MYHSPKEREKFLFFFQEKTTRELELVKFRIIFFFIYIYEFWFIEQHFINDLIYMCRQYKYILHIYQIMYCQHHLICSKTHYLLYS